MMIEVSSKTALRAKKAAAIKGLYCITAEMYSAGHDNISVVREMLSGGGKIVQYREKDMPMLRQYHQCLELRRMTADAGAMLIIDDHIDLALAVGADGVHIGQDDLPIEKAREIAGDELLIGLSTHSPEQALDAVAWGADYIGVGPIFETHTKKDVCSPVGLEYLDYVVKNIKLPFVAIGGIKPSNIGTVLEHGAACVALVTGIVGADNISGTVSEMLRTIESN
jgi:thiamine-phosphate pyrophosphorylase